jgi:esterase/lipase superfamily enzyme
MGVRVLTTIAVWFMVLRPVCAEEIVGRIKNVTRSSMVVTDSRQKDRSFVLTPATKILLPDKRGTIADLKPDYRVRVRYVDKKSVLTALEVIVQGLALRVVEVQPKTGMLILKDKQGKRVALPVEPNTTIRLDGQAKKLTDLREGDTANILIDDRDAKKMAMHIEAESPRAAMTAAGPEEAGVTPVEDDAFVKLKVFYGTDRNPIDASRPETSGGQTGLAPLFKWIALGAAGVALVLLVLALYTEWRAWGYLATSAATVAVIGTAGWILNQPDSLPSADKLARVGMWYGAGRGELAFGVCDVSIPKSHKHAELEGPNLLRGEFKEDPAKHIMLYDVKQLLLDDFIAQVKEKIKGSSKKDAFVFVHGYNVSFEDAARRTGQLAYDLKFEGAPMFYSWPAQGLFAQYTVDEANAEWAMPHLKQFLKETAAKTDAKVIHLIAHSMGNRVLTRALQAIAQEDGKDAPKFNEVILAAPDIDADVFRTQIYPAITDAAHRFTLYASSRDRALQLSKQVHGYPRAGESGNDILILPRLDSIDVSSLDTSIDGHTYYGDNSSVLSDAFHVLQNSLPPEKRARLRPVSRRDDKYWIFEP